MSSKAGDAQHNCQIQGLSNNCHNSTAVSNSLGYNSLNVIILTTSYIGNHTVYIRNMTNALQQTCNTIVDMMVIWWIKLSSYIYKWITTRHWSLFKVKSWTQNVVCKWSIRHTCRCFIECALSSNIMAIEKET